MGPSPMFIAAESALTLPLKQGSLMQSSLLELDKLGV